MPAKQVSVNADCNAANILNWKLACFQQIHVDHDTIDRAGEIEGQVVQPGHRC